MNGILCAAVVILDFIFSLLGYSLRESSRFKLGDYADKLKRSDKDNASLYEGRLRSIEAFLNVPYKRYAMFFLSAYVLDVIFVMLFIRITGPVIPPFYTNMTLFAVSYLLFIYVGCRLFPQAAADRRSESIVFHNAALLSFLRVVCYPLFVPAGLLHALFRTLSGVGHNTGDEEQEVEDEIKESISEGVEDGVLEQDEKDMIESVLRFDDYDVREIMTPRTDIVGIDIGSSLMEAVDVAVSSGFSRIPVFEETIDSIVGVLYVKDLLTFMKPSQDNELSLSDVARSAYYIPESKMISELFKEIREKKNHFAVILDEYGGTAGIVTAEDIIEEIVGEIEDEYDETVTDSIIWIADNTAKVDARVDIGELNNSLNISIPDDNDFESLGGFLSAELGKIPQAQDSVEYDGILFNVLSGTKRATHWVEVVLPSPDDGERVSV